MCAHVAHCFNTGVHVNVHVDALYHVLLPSA